MDGTQLNARAVALQAEGRFLEAIDLYKESQAMLEAAHGGDHPLVAQSLHNRASACRWPPPESCSRSSPLPSERIQHAGHAIEHEPQSLGYEVQSSRFRSDQFRMGFSAASTTRTSAGALAGSNFNPS